jgi:predicted lipoprotein
MRAALAALALLASPALAADHAAIAARALEGHVLSGFVVLADATSDMSAAAEAHCAGADTDLIAAYHRSFDAWMAVAHLRFGPLEEGEAGFAIAFWPDPRGATPRALAALVAAEDPIVDDPTAFAETSVAARGLFALDALLETGPPPQDGYACRLVRAVARDLARTAAGVEARWRDPYSVWLATAGAAGNPLYLSPEEGSRTLFTALLAGLQATADLRLGRPLGTLDRPQPRRAEAWRTARPARNAGLALAACRDLWTVAFVPEATAEARMRIDASFAAAQRALADAGEIETAVTAPGSRLRVEAAQQAVLRLHAALAADIGPALGVAGGFNSMDGD